MSNSGNFVLCQKGGFLCQHCGKSFPSKAYEKQHVERVHQKIKKVQCPKCPQMSYDETSLRQHMNLVHGSEEDKKKLEVKKLACDKCGHRFRCKAHLDLHVQTVHEKVRQYRCKICNVFFSQDPNLKEHIGVKHMGYKSAKEWRSPENKPTRQTVTKHEAYEFLTLEEAQKLASE